MVASAFQLIAAMKEDTTMRLFLATVLAALLVTPSAFAENWPHWRGPHFDGISQGADLPLAWTYSSEKQENIRWRVDLPGPGGATPIVWNDRIFVTSTDSESDALHVIAFDLQGKQVWAVQPDRGKVEVFPQFAHETNAAAPSPVTDGEHLWVLFGTSRLHRLDWDGKVTWTVDLAERYGTPKTYFGLSASPLLLDGKLYFHLLHTDAQLVLALDAATGKEIWKHERSTDATGECLHSYASVIPYQPPGQDEAQVVVHGADYVTGHALQDGSEVWRFGTLNPKEDYNSFFRLVATPVANQDGLLVVPTAKRGPVFGLQPQTVTVDGVTSQSMQQTWKLDQGTPDVPSPIAADGLIYLSGENGRLTVLDAVSGETVYAERVHQGQHRGSPVLADGKLYLTSADGTVSVVKPGRKYELLAQNSVEGERLAASPAFSSGTIYLRTYDALFALGEVVPSEDKATEAP